MQNNRLTILAINPGTRYIGFAVLRGPILADWGVNVIPGGFSDAKLKKARSLVSELIAHYQPSILALKALHPARHSADLGRLKCEIRKLATSKGLAVHEYSIQEIEAVFAPDHRINKTQLAELVVSQQPVLRHEFHREQDNYNPYHVRMFEAVALTMTAQAKIRGRHADLEQEP